MATIHVRSAAGATELFTHFVIASIPTAIVFITCQKVIMRGIVIPSMK